jgi:hypothetical protein
VLAIVAVGRFMNAYTLIFGCFSLLGGRAADAVLFPAHQDAPSATHEPRLTPLGENWTP